MVADEEVVDAGHVVGPRHVHAGLGSANLNECGWLDVWIIDF